MKKNYLFRTAMCLGIATMMSFCLTSGTYAKYTSSISSTADGARVAKFDFSLNTKMLSDAADATIDVFSTVNELSGASSETDINVGDNGSSNGVIIAPGCWGYVPVTVTNEGEVNIDVVFTGTETNTSNIPIVYGVYDSSGTAPTKDSLVANWRTELGDGTSDGLIKDLNTAFTSKLDTSTGKSKTVYVVWKWDYEEADDNTQSDSNDTTLGVNAVTGTAATVSLTFTCTATQYN